MKIFDTHCHYNLEPLHSDWQNHWQQAQENNVVNTMVIGADFASSAMACSVAETNDNFYAAIGIHPDIYSQKWISTEAFEEDIATDLEELALIHNTHVVRAIGEVGLDYYRLAPDDVLSKKAQQSALRAHILYAEEKNLPLILHVRDKEESAYWDTLSLLKSHKQSDIPFILHCVSGPEKYVQEALSMGAYVSVAGNVTYKNADHIRTLVSLVPEDKLLLETDAPFLPPQQYRGKQCEPWMISLTAEYLQDVLHRDLNQIYNNSLKIFNI